MVSAVELCTVKHRVLNYLHIDSQPNYHLPPPHDEATVDRFGNYIYYIHTEKYSPKSYVVNFRTQISSSQSEERTMVFTRQKK